MPKWQTLDSREDDEQEQAFAPDTEDLPDDAHDNCVGAEQS